MFETLKNFTLTLIFKVLEAHFIKSDFKICVIVYSEYTLNITMNTFILQ